MSKTKQDAIIDYIKWAIKNTYGIEPETSAIFQELKLIIKQHFVVMPPFMTKPCPHAYKMLDRAESLTCDDCLKEIVDEVKKKLQVGVDEAFIQKWGNEFLKWSISIPRGDMPLRKMLTEANFKFKKEE